jgi:hypothetical protein
MVLKSDVVNGVEKRLSEDRKMGGKDGEFRVMQLERLKKKIEGGESFSLDECLVMMELVK